MVHFVVLVMSECVRVVENMELDVMELQIGCVPFATKAGKTKVFKKSPKFCQSVYDFEIQIKLEFIPV